MPDQRQTDSRTVVRYQPRWAWWVVGVAVPVLGIIVTLVIALLPSTKGGHDDGDDATGDGSADGISTETTGPPLPSGSPGSHGDGFDLTPPEGYSLHEGYWGITPIDCTANEIRTVDLDTGTTDSATEPAGGYRGDPVEGHEGAELVYYPVHCGETLRNPQGTTVGLLTADMPHDFKTCQSVSGTGLGPIKPSDGEEVGFIEGAAICAVTDRQAIAMAMIDMLDEDTANGRLFVWTPEESA